MRLVCAVIPLVLIVSMIGMQESFAEQASGKPVWNTSGNKVCGDKLCSDTKNICDTKDPYTTTYVPPPVTRGYFPPFPRVADLQSNSIDEIKVGEQVLIITDLPNRKDCHQPYVWIIQIVDTDDKLVVFLGWLSGIMEPGKNYSQSVSWIPQQEGKYDIMMFLWASLDNPITLSPPSSTTATVA